MGHVLRLYAGIACWLVLGVSTSATLTSAGAQPSSGAAASWSVASPLNAPPRSLAKRASGSQSAPLPNFDDFPHRLGPAARPAIIGESTKPLSSTFAPDRGEYAHLFSFFKQA